jgi:branched-chain amino acid transport system substrate-binding protein
MLSRRTALASFAATLAAPAIVRAAEVVKVGVVTPLTGPFTTTGAEHVAAIEAYMRQHGDTVAGRKIQVIIKDDGAVPDTTKRLAQELVVNQGVQFLSGMGLTPLALAAAPIATQAKVPMVLMGAATSSIPAASPFIVRTFFAVPQVASVIGDWTGKNGAKTAMTMVSDYGPGIDNEVWFKKTFEAAGGKVNGALRVPLSNPDFAPFLQRVADTKPDALYIFVPAGIGSSLMRQFLERGLDKSGVRLVATGDLLDDQIIDQFGEVVLGVVSAYHYSDAHDSALNRRFTADVEEHAKFRANTQGVGAYDGMALIYLALQKTNGDTDGPKLIEAMKGMAWESPRGPISIDPQTRDIIQNVYMRRVEKRDGHYVNVEFATYPNVKDPAKPSA